MCTNACCLEIQGKYSSGIILNVKRGEIISITTVNILGLPNLDCTVWIQLGSRHNYLVLECKSKVVFSSSIPYNDLLNQSVCSFFVLVRMNYTFSCLDFEPLLPVAYLRCCPISQGDNVLIVGSPFGPLCPQVLLNNQFRGFISKSISSDLNMLLIDLFCPLGLVGAPVFIIKSDLPLLYGLLINDSDTDNNSTSDIHTTIFPVISILEITKFLLLQEPNSYFDCLMQLSRFSPLITPIVFQSYSSLIPQRVLSLVVKVQNNNICGSGILIANNICLTCAHIVSNLTKGDIIYISYSNNYGLVPYEFLFATPPNIYPDVAFLMKFGTTFNPTDLFGNWIQYGTGITIGRQIVTISFQNLKLAISNLTTTLGCINKVVKYEGNILFCQSSCCIKPGSSGGLVVDRYSFEILGMISGFTKIEMLGITYFHPQMSRFLPFETLNQFWNGPIAESCVEFIRNDNVQGLWNYSQSQDFLISKL